MNTHPHNVQRVLQSIRAEVDTILEDGITPEELQRAKDKWITHLIFRDEFTRTHVWQTLADWTRKERWISLEEKIQHIEDTTCIDVVKALRQLSLQQKQSMITLGPLSSEAMEFVSDAL